MGSFTARTCPEPVSRVAAAELSIGITLHKLLVYIAAPCVALTALFSLVLIFKHLHRYTKPAEQRQIVRLVFTPAVFAAFSLLALIFYDENEYITPLPDLYEAFALACLFLLFMHYAEQPTFVRRDGRVASAKNPDFGKGAGLDKAWVAVFQYPVVKTILTVAEEASIATQTYCSDSRSIHFAHIWIVVIGDVSLVVCFLTILRFYKQHKPLMVVHRPLLKLISFKLIVFVIFIQNLVFNFISTPTGLSAGGTIAPRDIKYGLPAFLICIEMVFFSIFLHFSYRSRIYDPSERRHSSREHFLVAAVDAINPGDMLYSIAKAFAIMMGGGGRALSPSPSPPRRHSSHHSHRPRYEHRPRHSSSHARPVTYHLE